MIDGVPITLVDWHYRQPKVIRDNVGVLNGGEAATLQIDLSFLSSGEWQAEVCGDDPVNAAAFKRDSKTVTPEDKLTISMSPRGGSVVWITKATR
jgi:hypothetical protein